MQSELSIGLASEVITPELGCEMAGFDARKGQARGVHDHLHARVMVLRHESTSVALVSLELLGIDREFATEVRKQVEERTGIPFGNIVLAATHTHCGPATFNHFYNQGQPLDYSYLSRLAEAIVAATENAVKDSRPRILRSGMVPVNGIAVNRRTESGLPVDPYAGVLLVEELDGTRVAAAIFYACHTTVLGPNTLEISGDFPFYTVRELQKQLGESSHVLFFNGAEGDISIGHKSDLSAVGVIAPFRTFEKAEELGIRLADAVTTGLGSLQQEDSLLRVQRHQLQLPLKNYPASQVMAESREKDLSAMNQLAAEELAAGGELTSPSQELLKARQRSLFSRIEEYYALLYEKENGPEPKALTVELTAIRIGNTALLSFPGEVFVEIALKLRESSPFARTMFLGLANDYVGYLPTAEADRAAGYEVVAARVRPEAAASLRSSARDLLTSLLGGTVAN